MNAHEIFEAKKRKRDFILTAIFVAVISAIFAVIYVKVNATPFEGKDIKIAVINKAGGDGWTFEYLTGIKQEAESMGISMHAFTANHNQTNFQNLIKQVDKSYNGVIIAAGGTDSVDEIKKIADKGIPVVTINSALELAKLKGVTTTIDDNGQLALDNMKNQLNGKGNIIYLSLTKDYPASMVRNKNYEKFLKENPKIKEVERYGRATPNTIMETKNIVAKMLKKHEKGKIDAIFATWEAFANGATQAVKEAGRNEIKIYGIGFTIFDLQIMQKKDSPWVATTGINPREIGAVNVRLLLKKIAGDETPSEYFFKPILITQKQLHSTKEILNVNNLDKIIKDWSNNKDFEEEWMRTLKRKHKKNLELNRR